PPASSLAQIPGNSIGASVPTNHAPTAASKYSNTDRPCCVHVAITVQIRSHQRFPVSLIFYSFGPDFDVSPLVMGWGSPRSVIHSATPLTGIPLNSPNLRL